MPRNVPVNSGFLGNQATEFDVANNKHPVDLQSLYLQRTFTFRKKTNTDMILEVSRAAAKVHAVDLLVMTPCDLVRAYQRFAETYSHTNCQNARCHNLTVHSVNTKRKLYFIPRL